MRVSYTVLFKQVTALITASEVLYFSNAKDQGRLFGADGHAIYILSTRIYKLMLMRPNPDVNILCPEKLDPWRFFIDKAELQLKIR